MARFLCVCILTAAPLMAFSADEISDEKAMQGTWVPVKAELSGQPWTEEQLRVIVLKLKDGQYEVSVAGKVDRGAYTLDPKSTPKAMTITGAEGPNKGKTFLCIYEISGDTLRVCYDLSGQKTPTDFATAKGTLLYLVTYTRKKE